MSKPDELHLSLYSIGEQFGTSLISSVSSIVSTTAELVKTVARVAEARCSSNPIHKDDVVE